MKEYTMKEAMELCGCTRKAIRYYERRDFITPIRKDHKVYLTKDDIETLHLIRYYSEFGLTLCEIEAVLRGEKEDVLQKALVRIEDSIEAKKAQRDKVDIILENLAHQTNAPLQMSDVLSLKERELIHDVIILPWRKYGQYVIREIVCTKKEYHRLRFLTYLFTSFLGIIMVIVLLERAGV